MSEVQPVALLVEDEPQVRHFVRTALEAEGWRVFESDTMKRGLIDAGSRRPDLVILDLGLPDGDGIGFISSIRQWSPVPIIILSARNSEQDKIRGLDAGADDYLAKPFGLGELLARVRAALRRQHRPEGEAGSMIEFGDVRVDPQARLVCKGADTVHLTPTEYRLLMVLVNHAGRVVTNAQLLREVWGPAHAENGHYVRIYMGHLRQKLENDPTRPRHIVTEPAVGYRLLLPV
ncbi:two-component system response regulator KdpE [Noviherbaspirillum sp. 1P10PC]|uniref:two-component system response regulator KdpE n=1 Tax=Noviherbaspirillum sp. 1P10PC TaxID=3132292 RepID=UPI0039A252E1